MRRNECVLTEQMLLWIGNHWQMVHDWQWLTTVDMTLQVYDALELWAVDGRQLIVDCQSW